MPTKIRSGKKYGRVQRVGALSSQQRKLLRRYMHTVKPEKTKVPSMWRKGNRLLRELSKNGPTISPIEQPATQFLQNLLNRDPEQHYQDFAAPFMRQFREETVPQLSEQFAGLGALGGSGFQNALGQAGAGLSENLASLKGNLINQLLGQQIQGANVGMGYSQLPAARQAQQADTTLASMQSSLVPQQMQQEADRYARGLTMQRQGAVLGTPAFNSMVVPPTPRGPSRLGAVGGFLGQGAGAIGGALIGNAVLPGIGGMIGAGIGGGIGRSLAQPSGTL